MPCRLEELASSIRTIQSSVKFTETHNEKGSSKSVCSLCGTRGQVWISEKFQAGHKVISVHDTESRGFVVAVDLADSLRELVTINGG
jgi:hypothetical protein